MVTVVTRQENGIPLTHDQVDTNFTNLATAINDIGADVLAEATIAKDAALAAAASAQSSAASASGSANSASVSSGGAATSAEQAALSATEAAASAANSAAYVGSLSSATGAAQIGTALGRTVQQQLDLLYEGYADITDPQYAGGAVAGTNCTAAWQAAINDKTNVFAPEPSSGLPYYAANLIYRTGSYIEGQSQNVVVKLLDNALLASHNGSVADSNGFYPGNVFASTLTHTGGIWYDGGVRACDETNSTYIYQDVTITNLTIDGNKANNQIGDAGQNRSAMGAAVSIHQCKNVSVFGCNLINNRLEGIHLGYTLHGGSDYCNISNNYFEGNQRINIAMITGKYNGIHNNTGKKPTGGTGVGGGSALDIEANFVGEVNFRHAVTGNNLGGALGMVAQNVAKLQFTRCTGNTWLGGLALSGAGMTDGVVINDTFISDNPLSDWLTRYGPNVSVDSANPTLLQACVVSGFNRLLAPIAGGQHENFTIDGGTFSVASVGVLVRPRNVKWASSPDFTFTGNADAATMDISSTLGATVPNQGLVNFGGAVFRGVSNPIFIRHTRDTSWAAKVDDFMFSNRCMFLCTGHTTFASVSGYISFLGNTIKNFSSISFASLNGFRLDGNDIDANAATPLFSGQTGAFNDSSVTRNNLKKISINAIRPKDSKIAFNDIEDGNIQIVYSSTAAGVGRNHVAHNTMTAKTLTIATPFSVTTGAAFSTADFVGNDQYKYNTFVGYTGAPSIAAAMVGKYDGTFV